MKRKSMNQIIKTSEKKVSGRGEACELELPGVGHLNAPEGAEGRVRAQRDTFLQAQRINDNLWKSMKIYENLWKSMKIYENLWKSIKNQQNQWKSMTIN